MLMRGIMTSYSRYFNRKYKRTGSLYESRYKSNRITDDAYNIHISRYIHMNPRYWHYYKYSSINFYLDNREVTWLNKYEVLKEFNSPNEYLKFLNDYQTNKSQIENIKACLVDY